MKPSIEVDAAGNSESTQSLLGSLIRDVYQEDEQAEIVHLARKSSCELGFEKALFHTTAETIHIVP